MLLIGTVAVGGAYGAPITPASEDGPLITSVSSPIAGTPLADEQEKYEEGEEEEEGAQIINEWRGLGGEAYEAPYIGLVELGVVLLVFGVVVYSLGKRTSIVPLSYRKRLLQAHEWTMLLGTALVIPHFVAVEEWEGLGILVGILLGVEVASGLYGRYLHRHVIHEARGKRVSPSLNMSWESPSDGCSQDGGGFMCFSPS